MICSVDIGAEILDQAYNHVHVPIHSRCVQGCAAVFSCSVDVGTELLDQA